MCGNRPSSCCSSPTLRSCFCSELSRCFCFAIRPLRLVMLRCERRCLLPDRLLAGCIRTWAEVFDVHMIRSIWMQHTIRSSILECRSFVHSHDENESSWNFDHGIILYNGGTYIGEPYLAQLGQHALMLDERCRAWSAD